MVQLEQRLVIMDKIASATENLTVKPECIICKKCIAQCTTLTYVNTPPHCRTWAYNMG